MQNEIALPPALATLANGRSHVNTGEYAKVTTHAAQTIRKNYSTTGHCFGIRPRKVGNILLWPVAEIAALLQGGQ
jgi:hypothetical protein